MAGLFTGDLERHHRITPPLALGQFVEDLLQHVPQAFDRVLPAAPTARAALSFRRGSPLLSAPHVEVGPRHRAASLSASTVLVSPAIAGLPCSPHTAGPVHSWPVGATMVTQSPTRT
jgi:hypothetical protein